jgi:mono/diheme cytochrome c family protein
MRIVVSALLLMTAACAKAPEQAAAEEPAQISFDGAAVTQASAKVAHGDRLMSVLGCRGCHTASLQGQQFYELYASNLTREVPKYSDDQLRQLIRRGVHPAGREVWGMPSEIFQHLSDADLAASIAYLRTLEPAGAPTGKPLPFEPEIKKLIAEGKLMPAAQWVRKAKSELPADAGEQRALGRYITMVTCAECHGPKLKGTPGDTPDLVVASAYSREEFEKLMTTGVPTGGRKLKELMADVSKNRFSRLTRHERDVLYAYLKARAEQPQ